MWCRVLTYLHAPPPNGSVKLGVDPIAGLAVKLLDRGIDGVVPMGGLAKYVSNHCFDTSMAEFDVNTVVLNGFPLPGIDGYVGIHLIEEVVERVGRCKTYTLSAIHVEGRLASMALIEEPVDKTLWQVGVIHPTSQFKLITSSVRIPNILNGDVVRRHILLEDFDRSWKLLDSVWRLDGLLGRRIRGGGCT